MFEEHFATSHPVNGSLQFDITDSGLRRPLSPVPFTPFRTPPVALPPTSGSQSEWRTQPDEIMDSLMVDDPDSVGDDDSRGYAPSARSSSPFHYSSSDDENSQAMDVHEVETFPQSTVSEYVPDGEPSDDDESVSEGEDESSESSADESSGSSEYAEEEMEAPQSSPGEPGEPISPTADALELLRMNHLSGAIPMGTVKQALASRRELAARKGEEYRRELERQQSMPRATPEPEDDDSEGTARGKDLIKS